MAYMLEAMRLGQYSLAAAQPGLAVERILRLHVPVPPVDEQYAIADFLDRECKRIDELRAEVQRHIEALLEPAVARYAELVRGMPRGRIEYRFDTQLGKMLDTKQDDQGSVHPYLRNANIQWDALDLTNLKSMRFTDGERRKFSLEPGDLLVCEGGQPGRAAVWNGQRDDCYFQKALIRARPRADDSPRFLLWALKLASARGDFAADGTGSTILHLPAERFAATRVPFCPPSRQREIVSEVDRISRRAKKVRTETTALLDTLTEYRDALITEAVTGKLDVTRLGESQMDESLAAVREGERPEVLSS